MENILRAGLDASGYEAGARVVTAANLRMIESANAVNTATKQLEGRFGGLGVSSMSSMTQAKQALDALNTPFESVKRHITQLEERFIRIGATITVFAGIGAAVGGITSFIRSSIKAVDDYQMALVGISASLTQILATNNTKNGVDESMPLMYAKSARYASVLAEKMREVDIHSVANYDQIIKMLEVYTSTGRVLDINNKKQMDGFTALSNAIPMMTAGQDKTRQMQTEMRALATGATVAGATIARTVDAMIKAKGDFAGGLKDVVKLSQTSGKDILELLEPYLKGYTAALPAIQDTFQTAKTSLETAFGAIQRKAFTPIVTDIATMMKGVSGSLNEGIDAISTRIQGIWTTIRDSIFDTKIATNEAGQAIKTFALKPEVAEGFKHLADTIMTLGGWMRWIAVKAMEWSDTLIYLAKAYGVVKVAMMANYIQAQLKNALIVSSLANQEREITLALEKMKADEAAAKVRQYMIDQVARQILMEEELLRVSLQRTAASSGAFPQGAVARAETNKAIEVVSAEQNYALAQSQVRVAETTVLNTQTRLADMIAARDSVAITVAQQQAYLRLVETQIASAEANVTYAETKANARYVDMMGNATRIEELQLQKAYLEQSAVSATQQTELKMVTRSLNEEISRRHGLTVASRNADAQLAIAQEALAKFTNEHALASERLRLSIAERNQADALAGQMSAKNIAANSELQASIARLEAAERRLTAAKGDNTAANIAAIAGIEAQIVALNGGTAATERLTVAQRIATAGATAMGAAARGLSYAWNLVGGTLGVILLALYAGYTWWNKYGEAAKAAREKAEGKVMSQEERLQALIKEKDLQTELARIKEKSATPGVALTGREELLKSMGFNAAFYEELVATENKAKDDLVKAQTEFDKVAGEGLGKGFITQTRAMVTASKNLESANEVYAKAVKTRRDMEQKAKQGYWKDDKAPDPMPQVDPNKDKKSLLKDHTSDERSLLMAWLAFVNGYYKDLLAEHKAGLANQQALLDESYRLAEISQRTFIDRKHSMNLESLAGDKKILDEQVKQAQEALNWWEENHPKAKQLYQGKDINNPDWIDKLPAPTNGGKDDKTYAIRKAAYDEEQKALKTGYELHQKLNAAISAGHLNEIAQIKEKILYRVELAKMKEAEIKQIEDGNVAHLKAMGLETQAYEASIRTAEYMRTVTNVNQQRLAEAEDRLFFARALGAEEQRNAEAEVERAKKIIEVQGQKEDVLRRQAKLMDLMNNYDLEKQKRDTIQAQSAFNASMVGTSPVTGIVSNEYANQHAIEDDRHNSAMQNLQSEMDMRNVAHAMALANSLDEQKASAAILETERKISEEKAKNAKNKGLIDAQTEINMIKSLQTQAEKIYPKMTSIAAISWVAQQSAAKKYTDQTTIGVGNMTKGSATMVTDFANVGAAVFNDLAASTDQSTRAGFESAKAYSIAGAVMSTAAAVMSQLASMPGPAGWAAAAAAAALGIIQIAKIASTTYGGGGSVSAVSSGSFSGGGAMTGGSVGTSIGEQYVSVKDSQTQDSLSAIVTSLDNASTQIGKVADGLTKVADLFTSGSYLSLAAGSLSTDKLNELPSLMTRAWQNIKNEVVAFANPFKIGNVISSIGNFLFGGATGMTGQGITLGLSNGRAAAGSYEDWKRSGGLFSRGSSWTVNRPNAELTQVINNALAGVMATISRASVAMNTRADFGSATLATTRISTAGKTPEQLQKEVQAWFESAANELAKTVNGLKEFAFYGENAFDALVRLSTALQNVNDYMLLIGNTTVKSTLEGANAAWKLQDMMGGLDKFSKKVDTYLTDMYTTQQQEARKAAQAQRLVTIAFKEMGIAAPRTKKEFQDLVNSMDVSTQYGAAMFAALMDISTSFALVQDSAQKAADALRTYTNDLLIREKKLAGQDTTLLELRIKQEDERNKALADGMDITQLIIIQTKEWEAAVKSLTGVVTTSVTTLIDQAKTAALNMTDAMLAIANKMKSIMTGPQAVLSPEAAYIQAKSTFDSLKNKTDLKSMQDLPAAADALLAASKAYNASGIAYQDDLRMVLAALNRAVTGTDGDPTLSSVNLQIQRLTEIRDAITTGNQAQLDGLTALLGPTSTLAILIGTWSTATSAELQRKREEAATQTLAKLTPLVNEYNSLKALTDPTYRAGLQTRLTNAQTTLDNNQPILASYQSQVAAFDARVSPELQTYYKNLNASLQAQGYTFFQIQNLIAQGYGGRSAPAGYGTATFSDWVTNSGIIDSYRGAIAGLQSAVDAAVLEKQLVTQLLTASDSAVTRIAQLTPEIKDLAVYMKQLIDAYYNPSATATYLSDAFKALFQQMGVPGFAVGTAYVPNDMLANIHEGEIIVDRQSANVLRKYGIPVSGSADNRETVEELKETNKQLAASIRVLQAGFSKLIEVNEKQAESGEKTASAARLGNLQ